MMARGVSSARRPSVHFLHTVGNVDQVSHVSLRLGANFGRTRCCALGAELPVVGRQITPTRPRMPNKRHMLNRARQLSRPRDLLIFARIHQQYVFNGSLRFLVQYTL